ncbi:hypothetical protein TNCV_65371 [Trichonephila clavipes]|nr:hypothetical protein TNCV_65371 [Trichonephila clavipes]
MDPQNFVAKLQQHMAKLKPLKSPSNRKQNIFVHKDLKSCSHVFIRIDRVKKALEPPYAVLKNSLAEIVEVEIEVVSPSIVPLGSFTELKSHCHLYGAQGQRQAYLLPMPR